MIDLRRQELISMKIYIHTASVPSVAYYNSVRVVSVIMNGGAAPCGASASASGAHCCAILCGFACARSTTIGYKTI